MASIYINNDAIWTTWTDCTFATTSATTTDCWPIWANNTISGCTSATTSSTTAAWITWCYVDATPRATPAQVEAAENAQREYVAAEAERTAKRLVAKNRAIELLMNFLNTEQKEEFKQHRRFTIRRARKRYVIHEGITHNVHRVGEDGKVTHNICAYIPGVPEADNMLAQKLMLEDDDEAFCKKGNVFDRGHRVGEVMLQRLQ